MQPMVTSHIQVGLSGQVFVWDGQVRNEGGGNVRWGIPTEPGSSGMNGYGCCQSLWKHMERTGQGVGSGQDCRLAVSAFSKLCFFNL